MENLFKSYNEITEATREVLSKKLCANIIEYLKTTKKMEENDIREFFLDVLKLSISADLNFANKEYDFYSKVFGGGMSYEQTFDRTNHGANDNFIEDMKNKIGSYKKEIRNNIYSLILHILASDGPINDSEKTFFNRIYK